MGSWKGIIYGGVMERWRSSQDHTGAARRGVLVKNYNHSNRWCMISQAPVLWLMTSPFTKVCRKIQIIRSSENCSPLQIHRCGAPLRKVVRLSQNCLQFYLL